MKAYLPVSMLFLLATSAESLTDGRHKLGAVQSASRKSLLKNHSGRRGSARRDGTVVGNSENCAHWYERSEPKEKFVEEYMRYCWSA